MVSYLNYIYNKNIKLNNLLQDIKLIKIAMLLALKFIWNDIFNAEPTKKKKELRIIK